MPHLAAGPALALCGSVDTLCIGRWHASVECQSPGSSRRRGPTGKGPPGGPASPFGWVGNDYWMSSKTPKIGMYNATIIEPMMAPSTAIMSGSISEVSASVVASTSWS